MTRDGSTLNETIKTEVIYLQITLTIVINTGH